VLRLDDKGHVTEHRDCDKDDQRRTEATGDRPRARVRASPDDQRLSLP